MPSGTSRSSTGMAVVGADSSRQPATPNFERAKEQDNAQPKFHVLGQAGEERDVRQDEGPDEGCEHARVCPGAGVDEELEVSDEVRIGELVEPGEEELDAEGGL